MASSGLGPGLLEMVCRHATPNGVDCEIPHLEEENESIFYIGVVERETNESFLTI